MPDRESDLRYHAARGDEAEVEKLLKPSLLRKSVDLESRDSKSKTALMLAAISVQVAVVDRLLRAGANVNARTQRDSIEERVARDAPPGLASPKGHTALMFACMKKGHSYRASDKVKTVMTLLQAGADVNARNDAGETALMILCRTKGTYELENMGELAQGEEQWNLDIAKALLEAGADASMTDQQGMTAAGSCYSQSELCDFLKACERRPKRPQRETLEGNGGIIAQTPGSSRTPDTIADVWLFAEPLQEFLQGLPVTVSMPDSLISEADDALHLHGDLIRAASQRVIQGEIASPMTESAKRTYIEARCGRRRWACYYASTDMYRYHVVAVFRG